MNEAKKALIMVHGRGAEASDILSLSPYLHVDDYALLAPQADNNTWYPASFLSVPLVNEPWLSSALRVLDEIVAEIISNGIGKENIYFLGFSQGACLALEYVTRNATRYGGVVAFTGGLIGDKIYSRNYSGDFAGTPVFIGTGNPDPHVPLARVNATTRVMIKMNAAVLEKVYENMGHTISKEELEEANRLVFNVDN